MKSKDDILPLKEALKYYLTRVFVVCDGNKTEMARRLKISVRTVRSHCQEFGLTDSYRIKPEEIKPVNLEIETPEYGPEFDCIPFVTPAERDEWYNKNFY